MPVPATCGGGERGSPLPLQFREVNFADAGVLGGGIGPASLSRFLPPQVPQTDNSEVLGPPSPSAPGPLTDSAPLRRHRGRRRLADCAVALDTSYWAVAAELNFREGKRATRAGRPSLAPPHTAAGNAPFSAGPGPNFSPASETREIPSLAPRPSGSLYPSPGPSRSPTQEVPAPHPQDLVSPSAAF